MSTILPYTYILCCLLTFILLLNIISHAFNRSIVWGVISLIFPPGTYYFCRKHWELTKHLALPVLFLAVIALVAKIIIEVM